MASQQPTYSAEDVRHLRLTSISQKVFPKVLHFIFKEASKRPQSMSLFNFDTSTEDAVVKFKKGLTTDQNQTIKDDPDGKTFDVTLLFRCLRFGSYGLAAENDAKWKEGNRSLESSITSVKNRRNDMAHEKPRYTPEQFLKKTEELRTLLTETLRLAGNHYGLDPGTVAQEIADMDSSINKYRDDDLTPLDFEEYKKQLLFPAQSDLVNTEGKEDVKKQHDNRSDTIVTTVNHLVDISNPVEDIFTDMILKNKDVGISFEDILQDETQNITDSIILVEGIAGVGKTTLVKKLLSDWMSDKGSIKHLDSYNLILHTECRNTAIKSFQDLLDHRMPNVARKFKGDDLKKVVLDQKILVILDGLDEINESSTLLFKEVLELKKDFGITVMVTMRPEKLRYFQSHVNSLQIRAKHIQLKGVPLENREEFIRRYYSEIAKNYSGRTIQPIDGLLHFLQETKYRLQDLWSLPYNLTLLTILWVFDIMTQHKINTAPELYEETDKLYESKLIERLMDCPNTRDMQDSERSRAVHIFMFHLAKEALIGLKNNHINLPSEAYKRLSDVCNKVKVPIKEMISAFLKRVPTTSDIIYSFPHKGIQDYKAAQYMWMILTDKCQSYEIEKIIAEIHDVFIQNNVPLPVIQDIERSAKKRLKETSSKHLMSILEDIGESKDIDMSKYQNVIINLIGLFFSESEKVGDAIKMEALEILQETGVRDRDEWIRILNSVKCDDFVISFIIKQKGILEGTITINDSSIFAYTSLLQGMKTPMVVEHEVTIEIKIEGETSGVKELMKEINKKKLQVTGIMLRDDFKNPSMDRALEDSTNEALKRCQVEEYRGRVTPGLVLPFSLWRLDASIADEDSFQQLFTFLNSPQQHLNFGFLSVCVRPNVLLGHPLQPLPCWAQLYIVGIQDANDVKKSINMAQQLNPTEGWFFVIGFPSLSPSLPVEEILLRIKEEKGRIRCDEGVVFPSCNRKGNEEELEQLATDAGVELHWGETPGSQKIDNW